MNIITKLIDIYTNLRNRHTLVSFHTTMSAAKITVAPFAPPKFICYICGSGFDNKKAYKSHLDSEILKCKDGMYKCHLCDGYAVTRKDVFINHLLEFHLDGKEAGFRFGCDHCNKKFVHKKGLTYHQINMPCMKPKIPCFYCDELFDTKIARTNHVQRHCPSIEARRYSPTKPKHKKTDTVANVRPQCHDKMCGPTINDVFDHKTVKGMILITEAIQVHADIGELLDMIRTDCTGLEILEHVDLTGLNMNDIIMDYEDTQRLLCNEILSELD